MITVLGYALMFACGALTKATDETGNSSLGAKWQKAGYVTAAAYGATAGLLVAGSAELATLILAMTTGMLFAGKIDSRQHQLGVALIVAIAALAGLAAVNLALFAFFAILCILDEALNDLIDRAKKKGKSINRALGHFLNARLMLEIGTLAFGLWSGNFGYFIALFLFDLAYNIAGWASLLKAQKAEKRQARRQAWQAR